MSCVNHTVKLDSTWTDDVRKGTITYPMGVVYEFVVTVSGEIIGDLAGAAQADVKRHIEFHGYV